MNSNKTKYNQSQEKVYQNLEEFYPFYLSQHANNMTRLLHYIGTSLSLMSMICGIYYLSLNTILFSFVIGYGFAWVGHFFFEKNKPATFKYPGMSFICDFIMLFSFYRGRISQDLKRSGVNNIKYLPYDFI